MPLADTGTRAATRVLAIYSLGGRLRIPADSTRSLAGHFELGRFAHHVEATASLLPRVTAALVGGAAVMRRRIQPRAPEWGDS